MRKVGRPPWPLRIFYAKKYSLKPWQVNKLTGQILNQLEHCKDDETQRIILNLKENDDVP